jgi:hypothetical protein
MLTWRMSRLVMARARGAWEVEGVSGREKLAVV